MQETAKKRTNCQAFTWKDIPSLISCGEVESFEIKVVALVWSSLAVQLWLYIFPTCSQTLIFTKSIEHYSANDPGSLVKEHCNLQSGSSQIDEKSSNISFWNPNKKELKPVRCKSHNASEGFYACDQDTWTEGSVLFFSTVWPFTWFKYVQYISVLWTGKRALTTLQNQALRNQMVSEY